MLVSPSVLSGSGAPEVGSLGAVSSSLGIPSPSVSSSVPLVSAQYLTNSSINASVLSWLLPTPEFTKASMSA